MGGGVEGGFDGGLLHAPAAVHDQDVVGEFGDDAEVVRDHDDGGVELLLKIPQQVQDLRLHRHVQRRRRLIGDQQLRIARQRHRDHRPLPHTAGELMRIVVHALLRGGNAHPPQHLDGVLARDLLRHVMVDPVRLDDLIAHRVERMHRRQRILEDHGHVAAARLADLLRGRLDEFLAVQPDLAGHAAVPAVVQAEDPQARHRLARTRLPHDPQGPSALELEVQPVHGLHQTVVGREVDAQVAHLQERRRRRPRVRHSSLTLGSITA